MKCSEEGQRLGVTTLRWGPNWGSLTRRPPCSYSAWWTAKESKCKDSHLIERGGENVLQLVLTFKKLCCGIVQRSPMSPCPAFPGVSILHMMVRYHNQEPAIGRIQWTRQQILLGFNLLYMHFFFLFRGKGSRRYDIYSLRICSTSSQDPNGQWPWNCPSLWSSSLLPAITPWLSSFHSVKQFSTRHYAMYWEVWWRHRCGRSLFRSHLPPILIQILPRSSYEPSSLLPPATHSFLYTAPAWSSWSTVLSLLFPLLKYF